MTKGIAPTLFTSFDKKKKEKKKTSAKPLPAHSQSGNKSPFDVTLLNIMIIIKS